MDSTIRKARQLFKKRYGAHLEIKWTNNSNKNAQRASWQSSFVYSRTRRQVSFPLFNNSKDLKAIAVASPVDNKDAILFEEMADFLKLTISEQIELLEKKELVENIEVAMNFSHNRVKNVIRMPRKRSKTIDKILSENKSKRKADNRPIYLYGENQDLIHNISMSAHEWSRNWALINSQELPDLIWEDRDQWKDFPQITIYVPYAESLTFEQQETLAKNIRTLESLGEKKPLIILTGKEKIDYWNPSLAKLFKVYKPSEKLSAKSQAHFLMFHFKNRESWTYHCSTTKGIFYYPFSRAPPTIPLTGTRFLFWIKFPNF